MNFAGCADNTSKDSGDTTQNQQKETEDSRKMVRIIRKSLILWLREYQSRYVKEFDDYEFIYETEECEYEIKAGSDVSFEDDLEKGKYFLELEYGDGIGLYRTDIEKKFAVVNTNTGRMVNIYMDCDLDSAEKKIELLRKELLK